MSNLTRFVESDPSGFRFVKPEAKESRFSEGAPGPAPRPGLVWNDGTHRWRNPATGEEHEHPAGTDSPTPASSGTSIPGHDVWRKKLPHPDTVTARPKSKKARAEVGRALQNAWTEARNALTVKYGTRDINDKMTPEESAAENDLHKTLRPLVSGNEHDGPHDLGPVSDQRYQGYYRAAVQALDKLRASASLPQAGSAPKSESLLSEADAHGEGEVWQSGKFWYTKKSGKVVRAKNPNAAADTGGEKKPGLDDAQSQALSKKAAETPGELTDAELVQIDAHLRTKSKAELTRIATQINGSGYEGMVAGSSVPELADSIAVYLKHRRDTEAGAAKIDAHAAAEAEAHIAALSKSVNLPGVRKLMDALSVAHGRAGWAKAQGEKERALVQVLDATSVGSGQVREHGMAAPEATRRVYLSGMSFYYPDTDAGKLAAAQTLIAMASQDWPPALVSATARIIITTQRNNQDPYWRTTYNDPNHVSNATGGDGQIVKYHGEPMGTGTFAHEAGHNVARKLWGSTHPDPESEYGKAQKAEAPVSDYGAKSPAEDFAEAVEHYTRYTGRSRLKALFPLKFAALQKTLGDTS